MTTLDKAKKVKALFDKEVKPGLIRDFKGKTCEIYSQGSACSVEMSVTSFEVEVAGIKDFGPAVYVFVRGDLVKECQHSEDQEGCANLSIRKHGHLKWYVDGVQASLKTKESVESVTNFLSEEVRSHIWN